MNRLLKTNVTFLNNRIPIDGKVVVLTHELYKFLVTMGVKGPLVYELIKWSPT